MFHGVKSTVFREGFGKGSFLMTHVFGAYSSYRYKLY